MTVLTDTVKNDYVGDNVQVAFPYTFKVFRADELKAYLDNVLETNYTVTGLGEDGGGTVTFSVAPGLNVDVRLQREMPLHQLVDYTEYDPFPAESHEMALDRIVMLVQQILNDFGLIITTSGEEGLVFPPYSADQFIKWDTSVVQLVNATLVAATFATASDPESVDGTNENFFAYSPRQLKDAVEAHQHKIETVATLPGTPDANTIYLVTT